MTAGGGMAIEGAYNGFKVFGPQISTNRIPANPARIAPLEGC